MAKKGKRKLKVTGQKPITNLKLRNGGSTTLYEVFAVTEDGGFVEESLRAFQELDQGQVIEFEIEPYNHPIHGMSYTLYPPKPEFARRVREMEETVGALVKWAETQGFNLAKFKSPEPTPPSPAEAAEAEAQKKEQEDKADEKFGKDAPWEDEDLLPQLERHAQTGSTKPPEDGVSL